MDKEDFKIFYEIVSTGLLIGLLIVSFMMVAQMQVYDAQLNQFQTRLNLLEKALIEKSANDLTVTNDLHNQTDR